MLVLGGIIGLTNLFAPLHELFHVMSAAKDGVGGHIVDWSHAQIDSPNLGAIVLAGWTGEIYFYCAMAILFALIGRSHPKITGAFPLGYMITTWIRGYGSSDFNEGIHNYVQSFPQYEDWQRRAVEDMYYSRIFTYWSILCIVLITVAGLFVFLCARGKKKPGGKSPRASGAGGSVKI